MNRNFVVIFFQLVFLLSTSCEVEGPAGLTSLVNLVSEPVGSNCGAGGTKIESGLDTNRDEDLDSDEVTQVQYVCNGANGSITAIASESAGSNCPYGGFKISTGIDFNFNKNLDPTEVSSTQYICAVGTDKQIRLPFPTGGGTRSTTYVISDHNAPQAQYLVKFNKLDYANVASIKFGVTITAGIDPMHASPTSTNTASVELFNVTDNVSVSNSEVQVTATGSGKISFVETGDLSASLPAKEIQLIIRIKTSDSNHMASAASPYLFIYKN
jgi:hypothetical protein